MKPEIGQWYRYIETGFRYELVQIGPIEQVVLKSPRGDFVKTTKASLEKNWEVCEAPNTKGRKAWI